MRYLIYYTDITLPALPDISKLVPLSSDSLEDAVGIACDLIAQNKIVWEIRGPDESLITRKQIEHKYWIRTGDTKLLRQNL